jgi:membrane protease YdiL (CAAX protease family)
VKIITTILVFYFLVLFPAINLAITGNLFIYEFWTILYFAFILVLALALKRISPQQLGFKNIGKTLKVGLILGLLPVVCVLLLDSLLIITGLSQSELFTGAEFRVTTEIGFNQSLLGYIFAALIIPFIDQLFVMGLVVNQLLKKQHTGQAIIGGGLLYSLLHFKPSLGNLFLGMISTGLLRSTGSIVAPIFVHTGFSIAEVLILFHYPRLTSLLVFFV